MKSLMKFDKTIYSDNMSTLKDLTYFYEISFVRNNIIMRIKELN